MMVQVIVCYFLVLPELTAGLPVGRIVFCSTGDDMQWLEGLASGGSCMSWENPFRSGRKNGNVSDENSARVC